MGKKYGVLIDDSAASYIEDQRIRFDSQTGEREILKRSPVIRELLSLGIVANKIIENSELDLEHGRPREAFVRQALYNELNREGLDDPREE